MGTPHTERDPVVDATLLPAGQARTSMPQSAGIPDPPATGRRFRWELWLGVALAAGAAAVTITAVTGLRGAPPAATPTAASTTSTGPAASQVVVARSGDGLQVTEHLVLPAAVDSIHLTRPDLAADPSITLAQPVISGLTASAASTATQVQPAADGWTVTGHALTSLTITYQASGAIVSQPDAATAGRALIVVTPVSAALARQLGIPITVTAPGIRVEQATCLTSPATQQLCGSAGPGGVTAHLTQWQSVAVVILQIA